MASLHKNSRMLLRKTARPSPIREKGVAPAPLSWISNPCVSPNKMARPSPNCPAHTPNWCPLYTLAKLCAPAIGRFPVSASSQRGDSNAPLGKPNKSATAGQVPTQYGAGKGVGFSATEKSAPSVAKLWFHTSPVSNAGGAAVGRCMPGLSRTCQGFRHREGMERVVFAASASVLSLR